MLPAIKAAAEERTPFVDGAPGFTQVEAVPVLFGGQQVDEVSRGLVGEGLGLVGADVVAVVRVEKKALPAAAAFGAGVTGDICLVRLGLFRSGLLVGEQDSVYALGEGITMSNNGTSRRAALATVGLGALAAGFAGKAEGAEMSALEKANVQVVNDFVAAWPSHDAAKIMSFFAETCTYRMTETMAPNVGREAVTKSITGLAPTVQGFEVLDTWARGPMVVNERIDRFTSGALKSWHGVGVFLVKDGKIVEWFDYTVAMERR